jgi:acyl-CoA hydrolase
MSPLDTERYIEQNKKLVMTILTTPDMANFSGYVHGGALLKLLDQVAYACASRYCKRYVITVSVDQVEFRQSVRVGELVTFLASVNYTGRTSMEIGIRVVAEDISTREERHVMTCYFTMVAVDDNRKPTKVPELKVETAVEQRRWRAAQLRRLLHKEIEERNLEIRLHPEDFEEPPPARPHTEEQDGQDQPAG